MKKFLVVLVLSVFLVFNYSYGVTDWLQGTSTDSIQGTDSPSDIDTLLANYATDPLDRLLSHYIYGCTLTRASTSTVTVGIGEVVCLNAADTIHRFRKNTATVTVTMPDDLDTGSEEASTWYEIYAVADADATTFTCKLVKQGNTPTGITYYRYLGSVYNDSGNNLLNFTWYGKGATILTMWDLPIEITSTLSTGAWSSATSCATGVPSKTTCAIFGLSETENSSSEDAGLWIRPNGTTWNTNSANGLAGSSSESGEISCQRLCLTDSSQQIQYYNRAGDDATSITIEGYYITR